MIFLGISEMRKPLQLCKTQEREYMTDGYDIITEISTTYNSEHSEVAQAF
jgi:hypothetical protein